MKASLLDSTNTVVGEFHVDSLEMIKPAVAAHLAERPAPAGHLYVECEGETWTVTSRDPVVLEPGRLVPSAVPSEAPTVATPPATPATSAVANSKPGNGKARWLRLGPFLGALPCFLLPFVDVSCRGEREKLSLTGLQLITGIEIGGDRRNEKKEIPGDKLVAAAAGATLLGVFLCLAGGSAGRLLPAISGIIALICLFVSKTNNQAEVLKHTGGLVVVDYQFGFVAACLLLLVGVGVCVFRFIEPGTPAARAGG